MSRNLVLKVFSIDYIKALVNRDTPFLMNVNRQILITYAFIRDINSAKHYYRTVMEFKDRITAQAIEHSATLNSAE